VKGLSKLVWPLIIGEIALEMLKGPLGSIIEESTSFKRAGAKIKEDVIGGLLDLWTLSLTGADAAVGRAEVIAIGKAKVKTASLARLGIDNAEFDLVEAEQGTVAHAKGSKAIVNAYTDAFAPGGKLYQEPGEDIFRWYQRVKDDLDTGVSEGVQKILDASIEDQTVQTMTERTDKAKRAVQQYLRGSITGTLVAMQSGLREDWLDAVVNGVTGSGWTVAQVRQLSDPELEKMGEMIDDNVDGTLTFLTDFMMRRYTGAIKGKVAPGFKAPAAGPPAWRRGENDPTLPDWFDPELSQLRKNTGVAQLEWFKNTSAETQQALQLFLKEGVGGLDAETQKRLTDKFGKDWLMVLRAGADGIAVVDKGTAATWRKALGKNWKDIVSDAAGATKAADVPKDVASKLHKAFGDGWFNAMKGMTGLVADEKVVTEMRRVFGENWREILKQAGVMVWEQGGGKDLDFLKAAIAARVNTAISSLTGEDLNAPELGGKPTGKKPVLKWSEMGSYLGVAPLTDAQVEAMQAKIEAQLGKAWVAANIDLLNSPDAEKAKVAASQVSKALAKFIPDPAKRAAFIETIGDIQKAQALQPIAPGLVEGLKAAGDAATVLFDDLQTRLRDIGTVGMNTTIPFLTKFFQIIGGRVPGTRLPGEDGSKVQPALTPPTPVGGNTGKVSARGNFLGRGQASWVGEEGRELFIPGMSGAVVPHTVSEFISGYLPSLKPMLAASAAAGARGGDGRARNQSIYVDRMTLANARDEQDVVKRLAFLMPGGR
jgi:hypothetical protein